MSTLLGVAIVGWLCSATLALVTARGRAAALARGEHLAAVAHELRGPLQAADLILAAAAREAADGPRVGSALSGAGGVLGALEVELGRLRLAVTDLTRPGPAGTRTPQPWSCCDADALVADLAPGWRAQAAAAGRTVTVRGTAGPLGARIERLRLAQGLGNLVANALEHGRGDIEVRVGLSPDGAAVQVEVRDEGPGLPQSVTALVARPPDPRRTRGRGLMIAAQVAADAGGRLFSAPAAHGTRLVLRVPTAEHLGAAGLPGGTLLPSGPHAS